MVAINPPFALQNVGATHTAENDRMMLAGQIAGLRSAASMQSRGGVHPVLGGALAVTQTGTPSMQVQVASGVVYVPGTEGAKQGVYACTNDGTVTLPIAAAHGSLARIDSVIARVKDSAYSGVDDEWDLEVVTGIAASSPVAPTLPANSTRVANVNVAAADTSITNSEIVDAREFLTGVGGVIPCLSANKPSLTLVADGQPIFLTDTGELQFKYGGSWVTRSVDPSYALPLFKHKTGDTSRASDTAFTADPHLSLALAANAIYKFEIVGYLTGSATAVGDYKWRMAFPALSEIVVGHIGMANGNAANIGSSDADFGAEAGQTVSPTDSVQFLGAISAVPTMHIVKGLIITGGTAGNLTLEWGQANSNATATVLKKGSHMEARRVG